MNVALDIRPRFSGHETFACRFAWIPKAVSLIESDPAALGDDDDAISTLGVGKNMVRALRFWLEAFDVAAVQDGRWTLSDFGDKIFGSNPGLDQFLERVETQWLLHWKVSTNFERPLFVWRHVFYRRHRTDFTRAELLRELKQESQLLGYEHSDVTLRQHAEVLLHSYISTSRDGAVEDALDGPLIDLGLIAPGGHRLTEEGRSEPVYLVASNARPPSSVVDFAIRDFWQRRRSQEAVVTLQDLTYAEGSPGMTLRLSEDQIRGHVSGSAGYGFRISAGAGAVHAGKGSFAPSLREVYEGAEE